MSQVVRALGSCGQTMSKRALEPLFGIRRLATHFERGRTEIGSYGLDVSDDVRSPGQPSDAIAARKVLCARAASA